LTLMIGSWFPRATARVGIGNVGKRIPTLKIQWMWGKVIGIIRK